MYTDFYNLSTKPFQISSDPAFIWLGEKHKEALATLKYGVIDNKGLMLLTGDVGTGKTTLINTLLESLSADVSYSFVPDPRLNLIDLLNYIAQGFHIDNDFDSKGSFLIHFGWFLEGVYKQNKKALLIIDEAQLLTQDLLEEIRLLSNIHRDGNHLLNIFFVGQNEFNEILHRPENRAVTQRITLNYQINSFTMGETAQYISHRLNVAGASHSIFDTSAVKAIYHHSEGIPRRINVICDHCLITGYIREKSRIDAAIVKECIKDIEIPHPDRTAQAGKVKTPSQTPAVNNLIPREKEKRSVLALLSILILFGIIGTITFFYIKDSEKFMSTLQSGVNYLSSKSDTVPAAQQQEEESLPTQNEPPSSSEIPTKSSAETLPDKEESIVTEQMSTLQQKNKHTPAKETDLETVIQTTTPNISANSVAIEVDTMKTQSPEEIKDKIKIKDTIEIRANSDIQDQPQPVHPLPVSQNPALKEQNSPPEQSETLDTESSLALLEKRVIIRFDRNSNDFSAANLDALISLGLSIKKHPSVHLHISGYTDAGGPDQYNTRLSLTRATMIKSYLLGLGISPDRMTVEGLGSKNPIADNTTEEGKRLNRRVEIEVVSP